MPKWELFLEQLLKPVDFLREEKIQYFRKMARERAEEISDILVGLSKYKLEETYIEFGETVYRPKFKNIKTNADLAREEFRGAVTRYLLGIDDDALIHACFALEAGLLIKDEEKLQSDELMEYEIKSPFTLGKNIGLWKPKSKKNKNGKGFIRDKDIIKRLERLQVTRNCHIHGFNFIAATVMFIKKDLEENKDLLNFLETMNVDLEKASYDDILDILKLASGFLPNDVMRKVELFLNPNFLQMVLSDAVVGAKIVENLSNFRWCAQKESLKLVNKRLERYGMDLFHLMAKETLIDTFAVLSHIGIF